LNYPEKAILSYERCGSEQDNYIIRSCGCGDSIVNLSKRCNHSYCINCAPKRKRRWKKKLLPYLKEYKNNHLYKWRFLTISPQNFEDYEEGVETIRKAWSKFLRRKYITERIQGSFYVIEVTEDGKGWNFHIHAIFYSRH